MVQFKIRVNEAQHTAYIPRQVFEVLGVNLTAMANRCAVLLFPEETSTEDVMQSLQIILDDLRYAQQLERKKASLPQIEKKTAEVPP